MDETKKVHDYGLDDGRLPGLRLVHPHDHGADFGRAEVMVDGASVPCLTSSIAPLAGPWISVCCCISFWGVGKSWDDRDFEYVLELFQKVMIRIPFTFFFWGGGGGGGPGGGGGGGAAGGGGRGKGVP
eukprot:COSAG05_NODE_9078_length_648_cov_1.223636_1_plen_127_part_01